MTFFVSNKIHILLLCFVVILIIQEVISTINISSFIIYTIGVISIAYFTYSMLKNYRMTLNWENFNKVYVRMKKNNLILFNLASLVCFVIFNFYTDDINNSSILYAFIYLYITGMLFDDLKAEK